MVVCKCRKATRVYCFVHQVPVCGECICFPEHQLCVVKNYAEWVVNSDYDWPQHCSFCNSVLEAGSEETTRLGCLHVMHTKCLISHIQSFPTQTAPAGYVCPSCSTPIWPPSSIKDTGSRLHSKLKEAIVQTGLEKNVFGNHYVAMPKADTRTPPAFASDPLRHLSSSGESNGANTINSAKDATLPSTLLSKEDKFRAGMYSSGTNSHVEPEIVEIDGPSPITTQFPEQESNFVRSPSPHGPGAMTRKGANHVERQNSEISYYADDEDGNHKKYTKRGTFRHKFLRMLLPFCSGVGAQSVASMAAQPPPPPAVEARFADLCKELGVDEGVASEAAALLEEGKGALLASPSFGSRSPEDVERLCFAFVLYCAAKLKGRKEESSGVRLCAILKDCKLKWDDFFKESQQLASKIDHVLGSRYGLDWEDRLELKQLENLVNLLADASRFYRKAFNELFSSASTDQEPGSTTNIPEYICFGWLLFLMLRSKSPELFKDLVSCIHGLVAILAILLIHVPAKFRSFTIEGSSHLIKQTERGVDLLASLCHNYHTSEDRLKELMEKSHKAIEDFFSKKALSASGCKTENLDKIDTDGLMYFKDLLEEECFQSNFEKLEKLSNTTGWEGELDLKMFLINNDNILGAENSSVGSTNLSCSKRVFETLASPTKTIKNMLTVPSSPSSPANGGSVKIVQMTPVTSAMTTAKWLREVISSLPEKPSSKLEQFLSSCDTDLTNDVTKRVSIILEAIFPTKTSGDRGGSIGLNCANAFDIPWAEARKMEASKLYYRVLEAICRAEAQNSNVNNLTPLLSNERFHRCLIACSAELVLATHKTVIMMFPAVLESTGLTAFDLSKIIENFVRHEETLPRELKRHLNSLEEQLLESMAWEKGSSLYNSLVVARPSLASEINRLGLLAEPMPSLDDIIARQNIYAEGLPATPSKKRAAGPDNNGDPQSPKRLCNEFRNTLVERNLQTPPPKQSHMVLSNLKAKWHPLQSTFASPTVSNPVGGNEKCAEVGVQIFFSKIWKLAAIRIRNLCERLRHVEQTERVYNIFKQILDQQTALFFNRHVDQLILCCLYGVAKVSQLTLTFKEIVNNYKREPQCKPEVFRSVFVGSTNRNGGLGSRHVDIIVFYNEVFVPAVKPLLVALIPSSARSEDKKNANSQIPGSPKPSPFSNLPDMSPKKVSSSHNVYVSPLRQTKMDALLSPSSRSFYACIGESTHAYQSPSKDLAAINNRLNYTSRRINTRINFDMVSDSVVAGSLGQPNGSSASSDPAAAFSPLSKKGKPES